MSSRWGLLGIVALCGCNLGPYTQLKQIEPGSTPLSDTRASATSLPPRGVGYDDQNAAPYTPADGVGIVTRYRTEAPASGLYNVCYINAFQTMENEVTWWKHNHDGLILRTPGGRIIYDDWGQVLLDTRTADQRTELAEVIGGWIDACAQGGYDAVDLVNVDSYDHSSGLLNPDDAASVMQVLTARAHTDHLAAAQHDAPGLANERATMGTDFAVVDGCAHDNDCDLFIAAYGANILEVEHNRADFDSACAAGPGHPVALRDKGLLTPDRHQYLFDHCE